MARGWFLFLSYGEWALALAITLLYYIIGSVVLKYKTKRVHRNVLYLFVGSIGGLFLNNIIATLVSNKL